MSETRDAFVANLKKQIDTWNAELKKAEVRMESATKEARCNLSILSLRAGTIFRSQFMIVIISQSSGGSSNPRYTSRKTTSP